MHIHIATVGETIEPLEKVINNIRAIDKLYLLYTNPIGDENTTDGNKSDFTDSSMNNNNSNMPSNLEGTTNAYRDFGSNIDPESKYPSAFVAKVIEDINKFKIKTIELVKTDPFDFKKIVDDIINIYKKEKGKGVTFSINITGGTKAMACAACYSSFYTGAQMYYSMKGEGSNDDLVKPLDATTPVDLNKIKQVTKDIFRFIYERTVIDGGVATNSLITSYFEDKTEYIKKNGSKKKVTTKTVSYHIGVLRKYELIKYEDPNKKVKSLIVTDKGKWTAPNLYN